MDKKSLLRKLPKVDNILLREELKEYSSMPHVIIMDSIREVIDKLREKILKDSINEFNIDDIVREITLLIEKKGEMHLKKVINATGTVLHTNLGRACLSKEACNEVLNVSRGYSNLEFDLDKGERGSRYSHVEELICKITGAEAAMVVNNNAAAVMLALSTLSKGREAIVSRGQLVEIGGSFRVPSVMSESGAILNEVGTTNRTHLFDYKNAVNENTGVILKVHQSNYRILGFTEDVSLQELVALGNEMSIPVIEDIGSGVFVDFSKYGLTYEPTVQESIKAGADVVTFSGDKMLGGPQAGIIIGKKEFIEKMKKNQLTRALRIDKMTLAALEATLRLYLDENEAVEKIPTLNMLLANRETLKKKANRLNRSLKAKISNRAEIFVDEDLSQVGGGAMPLERIPSYAVYLKPFALKAEEVELKLRMAKIPVIVRITRDYIVMDVRTIFDSEISLIVEIFDSII